MPSLDLQHDFPVLVLDADRRVHRWNTASERAFGDPSKVVLSPDLRRVLGTLRECPTTRCTSTLTTPDGAHYDGTFRIEALRENGELVGALIEGVASGTDDVRTAELSAALRDSDARFAKVFHAAPHGICIADRDSAVFLDANPAFLAMLGKERAEVIGRSAHELGLWPDPHRRSVMVEATNAGVHNGECSTKMPNGEVRHLLHSAEPLEMGGRACILSILCDITEHKRSQEALRQAQKMDAVGRLAAGLAHDFNNLLSVLSTTCFLLPREIEQGKPVAESLTVLEEALDRGASLTRQLLALTRQQVVKPTVLDLNAHLERSSVLLRRLVGEDILVQTECEPGIAPIRFDPGQLEQVLLNLGANARDAMPSGGRFTMRTRAVVRERGPFVELSVSDTGDGMSEDVRKAAFEPFFTTKNLGKGTGLGLAVVHSIVRQAKGEIEIRSELGAGTTITILLPAVELGSVPAAPGPRRANLRGSETVLVVEDDDALRRLVSLTLQSLGYQVLQAKSGEEATTLFRAEARRIRLLLTDVIMPRMSGRQLGEALRREAPDLRVIYMSGYTDDDLVHRGALDGREAYLQKPFSVSALSVQVRKVLDTGLENGA